MTLKSDDGDVQFWPRGTDSSTDFQSGWWFGTFFISHNMLGIILPIDFHIFQRGWNHQPAIITASTAGKITVRYTVQSAYCIYDYNRLYTYYLVPWNHMTCDLAILTHQLIPLMLQVEVIHFRFHVSIYVNPSIRRVAILHIVLSGVAVLRIPKSRGGRTALVGNRDRHGKSSNIRRQS